MSVFAADALAGRVALVTGGGSGIGREIAVRLAAAGALVAAADLSLEGARATAAQIAAAGGRAEALQADVADPAAVKAMVEQTERSLGTVGVLVNAAGLQYVSPIDQFPTEKWNLLLAVMLTGPFLCTRAVLPSMRRAGWGRIINISSAHGKYASPFKAAYVSAKHGLIGLTRATAVETATAGITANAICPGFVDTPLVRNQIPSLIKSLGVATEAEALEAAIFSKTPQRRLLDVGEIADMAVYLSTDAARGITGQAIGVDGGWVMY